MNANREVQTKKGGGGHDGPHHTPDTKYVRLPVSEESVMILATGTGKPDSHRMSCE